MTAVEIARGRWELDNERLALHCGCLFVCGPDGMVTRRVRWCERHRPTPLELCH